MVDKATRERLKEKAKIAKVKKALTTKHDDEYPVPPLTPDGEDWMSKVALETKQGKVPMSASEIAVPKEPKMRKCCNSPKGQQEPHAPDCPSLKRKKPKPGRFGLAVPPGWRWPLGTTISKRWNGVEWSCYVEIPGIDEAFRANHTGSFKAESRAAEVYIKWSEEKSKKGIDTPTAKD